MEIVQTQQSHYRVLTALASCCLLLAGCENFEPSPGTPPGPYRPPRDAESPGYLGMVNRRQSTHLMGTTFPQLSAEERRLLRRINSQVNNDIVFLSDAANYGVMDRAVTEPSPHRPAAWGYPVARYGDCEDYALTKKHRLVQSGMSASRIFVVRAWAPDIEGIVRHVVVAIPEGNDWWILNNWDDIIERASTLEAWWGWEFTTPRYVAYRDAVEARNTAGRNRER